MALYNIQSNVTGRVTVQAKVIDVKRTGGSIAASGALTTRTFAMIFRSKASLSSMGTVSTRDFIKRSLVRLSAQGIGQVIINAETWKFKGVKAQLQVGSTLEFYSYDRDIYKDMASYVPTYYEGIKQMKALLQALAPEFTRLQAIIQDIFRQFVVNEATWGLDYFDPHSSSEQIEKRRKRIMDILAAQTFRNERIKELVGYGCEITEQFNDFIVDILITEVRGKPGNIEEIAEKLDKYFPSHSDFQLKFSYTPWREYEDAYFYWGELDTKYTWGEMEEAWPAPPVYMWSDIDTMMFSQIESYQFISIDSDINRNKPAIEQN
ncbi:YmfQ family protein [Anoxybacillus sp. LAT_38]|uniref:putative phage tail protein n=1 Tax=Anoxybacillus sp. LAT_26 TaxID=2862719 RepID=UPI001EEC70D2|nr:putative phage tail protein [Anoxybacillus sp. LAT_26]MCG6183331.1 YmfQ family protein [Anoxybacillus sp. LAT_26]MCG6199224.1 YmfQ family protein [Anoxybacillus sp. LAT_38]